MLNHLQNIPGVTVGRIHSNHVYSSPDQCLHPLFTIRAYAHRRAYAQAPPIVFTGKRELGFLFYVLDCDQPLKVKFFIHHQKLFDPVAMQDLFRLIEIHSRPGGN